MGRNSKLILFEDNPALGVKAFLFLAELIPTSITNSIKKYW